MSCLSCGSKFRLFNREVACPACEKEYCSSCIQYTMQVEALGGAKKKVCGPCFHSATKKNYDIDIEPKALLAMRAARPPSPPTTSTSTLPPVAVGPSGDGASSSEQSTTANTNLIPSDEEIKQRLAKLRGEERPTSSEALRPLLIYSNPRKTLQEQQDDLLAATMAIVGLEKKTSAEEDITRRLENLRKDCPVELAPRGRDMVSIEAGDVSTADLIKRLIHEAEIELQRETSADTEMLDDVPEPPNITELDELPWCVICNENALLRCIDCDDDLYCRRCFDQFHDASDPHKTKPFSKG